jgi:o-succinylbenzoate synthase
MTLRYAEHMNIDRIELREIRMELKHPFETSFGVTTERRMILVSVFSGGLFGIGEVACGEVPGYNHETTDTAWSILEDIIVPRVLGKSFTHPSDLEPILHPIRGNHFTKGGLEMAVWDLFAKAANLPLWKYLGGVQTDLPVGISIGIKKSPEVLAEFVLEQEALGYKRIKLKIGPGRDVAFVTAARAALKPETRLTSDANSAYTLGDLEVLKALDGIGMQYMEQPLEYDDLVDHATLQKQIKTPICLDEPIHSVGDVRKAKELGSGSVINLKLGRVGGHLESQRIAKYCFENGIDLWAGGMLESGVGRAHNVAMQTQAGFNLASDTAPSNRYWHEDIIEPEIMMVNGITHPLEGIGIGATLKDELIHSLTARVATFK